jgi:ribosomal protein S15P/S13E
MEKVMLKKLLLLLLLGNGLSLAAMEPAQTSLLTRAKNWLTGRSANEQEAFGGYFIRIDKMPTQLPSDTTQYEELVKQVGVDFAQKFQKYALSGTPEAHALNNRLTTFLDNHIAFLNQHSAQEGKDFAARRQVLNKVIQNILVQAKPQARL